MVKRERERSMEGLTDEERRALRGSKFAHLPLASSSSRSKPKPRLPHPGGPLTTNKAAALVKFLERKLQEPNGLVSIKPKLVERAVKNAKDIIKFMTYKPYIHDPTHDLIFLRRVFPFGLYGLDLMWAYQPVFTPRLSIYWDVVVFVGRIVRNVDSFGDYENTLEDGGEKIESKKHKKKKKKKKKKKDKGKKKKRFSSKDIADAVVKRPKKKLKL
ncbi:unnamed protein product [Camellia sinensis]